jgi:hypothetical protein
MVMRFSICEYAIVLISFSVPPYLRRRKKKELNPKMIFYHESGEI